MANIRELLKNIEGHVRLTQPDALWNAQDIANYLRLAKSSVQKKILIQPNFPKPITIPGSNGKRWQADLVKTWARREGSKK